MLNNKPSGNVPPVKLAVRCFAEHEGSQWQAFSLELGLAAQGDTFPEVKRKLESMIATYVAEAVTIDREHSGQLLARKATWQTYARYYLHCALHRIRSALRPADNGEKRFYSTAMPLAPTAG